jgi:hypothetical protein
MSTKLVTIIDKENSMYVGELVADRVSGETNDHLVIKNPVGIAYPRDKDGNVTIAVVPIVYQEFLSEKALTEGIHINFYTHNLKWYGQYVDLHPLFIEKYESIFKFEPKTNEEETPTTN